MQRLQEMSLSQRIQKGQEALARCDAQYMFDNMPHGMIGALELKALISMGITSGLRGVSLRSLRWSEITAEPIVANSDMWRMSITVRKTKGDRQPFPRTFEGTLTDPAANNVVYHVLQYLRDIVRSKTATFADIDGCIYRDVFPRQQCQYNSWLKELAIACGYPPKTRFTVHSFRAGFLLDTVARSDRSAEAIQNGSLVAGWALGGASCLTVYIKECLEGIISCTRVSNGNRVDIFDVQDADARDLLVLTGRGVVLRNALNNPAKLHKITLKRPCATKNRKRQLFASELSFALRRALGCENERQTSELKRAVIAQLLDNVVPRNRAKNTTQRMARVHSYIDRTHQYTVEHRWHVREIIEQAVLDQRTVVTEIKESIPEGKLIPWTPTSHPKHFFIRSRTQAPPLKWTHNETQWLLAAGMASNFAKGWANAASKLPALANRKASQCNSRMFSLRRRYGHRLRNKSLSGMQVAVIYEREIKAKCPQYRLPVPEMVERQLEEAEGTYINRCFSITFLS